MTWIVSSFTQVNDFLTGRSPLVLAMKLGDNMMFIQLQLSTSQCGARRHRPGFPSSASSALADKSHPQHQTLGSTSIMNASQNFSRRIRDLTKISKVRSMSLKFVFPWHCYLLLFISLFDVWHCPNQGLSGKFFSWQQYTNKKHFGNCFDLSMFIMESPSIAYYESC